MGRLDGKAAIVTGAGSIGPGWGNGKATAVLFAREGAKVLCADVNRSAAEETAAIIREEGNHAVAFDCDVTDSARVKAMVHDGGYATEEVAPAKDVVRIPDSMDFTIAAGFPIVYGTSHVGLKDKLHL
ncbi:MAG: SDR family NAD(P)-dependent oxidoreductase, partial [Rickettsiales bacterium]